MSETCFTSACARTASNELARCIGRKEVKIAVECAATAVPLMLCGVEAQAVVLALTNITPPLRCPWAIFHRGLGGNPVQMGGWLRGSPQRTVLV